jgi:hypothetical protein
MKRDVGKFRIIVLNAKGQRTAWMIGLEDYWVEDDLVHFTLSDERENYFSIPEGGRFIVKSNAGWWGDQRDMDGWLNQYPLQFTNGGVITAGEITAAKIEARTITPDTIPAGSIKAYTPESIGVKRYREH